MRCLFLLCLLLLVAAHEEECTCTEPSPEENYCQTWHCDIVDDAMGCFPSDAWVLSCNPDSLGFLGLQDVFGSEKRIKMSDLTVGTSILTRDVQEDERDGSFICTTVIGFLYHDVDVMANYVELPFAYEKERGKGKEKEKEDEKEKESLFLSPNHLLYSTSAHQDDRMIVGPAVNLSSQSLIWHAYGFLPLLLERGSSSQAQNTSPLIDHHPRVQKQGQYAPLTTTGTMLVNGVLTSNYIGGTVNSHDQAHRGMAPLRGMHGLFHTTLDHYRPQNLHWYAYGLQNIFRTFYV